MACQSRSPAPLTAACDDAVWLGCGRRIRATHQDQACRRWLRCGENGLCEAYAPHQGRRRPPASRRRARLFAYLDPWIPDNVYGTAYQLSHSLIAVGRGEWFGVGLGSSIEKLHYLPEAHTDFIVSVIGEELGFMGIALIIGLFLVVIVRCFEIGRQSIAMERVFSGLVAQGVGIWFGVQAFINIGVCLGLLPTKGLTLPLISYGGSGLVMNLIALAIVARADYENKVMMRGGRK